MDKWDWTKSNGQATDDQTKSAYNVISKHGLLVDFSYIVWNDLVKFINNLIISKGKTWNTTIATLEDTLMSVEDKTLTAKRFNALYTQLDYTDWTWKTDSKKDGYVGDRLFLGVSDNAVPDSVYGYYFTELVTIANNMI